MALTGGDAAVEYRQNAAEKSRGAVRFKDVKVRDEGDERRYVDGSVDCIFVVRDDVFYTVYLVADFGDGAVTFDAEGSYGVEESEEVVDEERFEADAEGAVDRVDETEEVGESATRVAEEDVVDSVGDGVRREALVVRSVDFRVGEGSLDDSFGIGEEREVSLTFSEAFTEAVGDGFAVLRSEGGGVEIRSLHI